jgi:nitrate reductase molybdenum cofactor assembly chaperone
MKPFNHYFALADLFDYPDQTFPQRVQATQTCLDRKFPAAATELHPFTAYTSRATLIQMEEVYTRSFDVQAITTLDIGYVLFGDDYKRGRLLVHLNEEHRLAGVDCKTELADHLPNVLRLLARMEDPTLREELVVKIVAPALDKVISEFDPEKIQQKNKIYKKHQKTLIQRSEEYGTIYQYPLKALHLILATNFELKPAELTVQGSDFLNSVGSEIRIEANNI